MKNILIRIVAICMVLFALSSFTNAVGYKMVQSPEGIPRLTVDIITDKRIYLDCSYFNATIIVTNKGLENFEGFDLSILLSQAFPSPRVPNEYEKMEFGLSLEPGESYQLNFSCRVLLMAMGHFGIFPLHIWIDHDNATIKEKIRFFLIFDPILDCVQSQL